MEDKSPVEAMLSAVWRKLDDLSRELEIISEEAQGGKPPTPTLEGYRLGYTTALKLLGSALLTLEEEGV